MTPVLDLLLYTGSVYGWSWFLTKSTLFGPVRERLFRLPFIGKMLECIICTSAWVGGAIILALPFVTLVGDELRLLTVFDLLFITGWNLFTTCVICEIVSRLKR